MNAPISADHAARARAALAQDQEGRAPEEAAEVAGVQDQERPAAAGAADAALVEAQADRLDRPSREDGREAVGDLVEEDDEDPEREDEERVPERERQCRDAERQPDAARRGFQLAPQPSAGITSRLRRPSPASTS